MSTLLTLLPLLFPARADSTQWARDYAAAIESINRTQADKPKAKDEDELAKQLPAAALERLQKLLAAEDSPATREALVTAASAALDLDRVEDFELVRARLAQFDVERARAVGIALSRSRFLALGRDGVEPEGLAALADAFELVLDGYDEVFGLSNFSKVPGKKLRLVAHLVPKIERPPHFAPQFPYHSEIDFPVVDPKAFRSPTADGKFLFYGLCHELGHVLAMWGDRTNEEDRHAWAHYTGVVLVEHLTKTKGTEPALKELKDARWRSLTAERQELAEKKVVPGPRDADTVLARFVALHDAVGPRVIGEALDALDRAGKHQRVHRVRYYAMRDFRAALLATKAGKAKKKAVEAACAGS